MGAKMVHFRSEKISPAVTRIHGVWDEQMYLIEGTKKAALIDTGIGVGSLRKYVETITKKPIIVLLTHGHLDHAMGAPEFEEVYMNRKDDYIYNQHSSITMRKSLLEEMPIFKDVEEDDYIPVTSCDSFENLKGGAIFDLGDVTIEIYDCVGHTLGSVVMLLKEERTLITGDACNSATFLFDDYSTGLKTYEESLRRLDEETRGKYDRVYLSHRESDADKDMIISAIAVCEDIRAGKADNDKQVIMGKIATIAKRMNTDMHRIDGGSANIFYDLSRVNE